MSTKFSDEQLTRCRDAARRISLDSSRHGADLGNLLAAAELELARAQTAALGDGAGTEQQWQLLSAQVMTCSAHVDGIRQLCLKARQQHLAVGRLLKNLNDTGEDDAPAATPSRTVLVVDDLQGSRDFLKLILSEAGFIVRTAGNGVEALLAAYEMQPSVIIMDVMMPVLDGIAATRLIKTIDELRAARIIAYTASTPLQLTEPLFVDILPKPSSAEVLLAAVERAVTA